MLILSLIYCKFLISLLQSLLYLFLLRSGNRAPCSCHCECACGSTGAGRGSCDSVPAFTLQDSPGSSAVTAGLLPSALSQTLLLKKHNYGHPSLPSSAFVCFSTTVGHVCARPRRAFNAFIYVCSRISTRHDINRT